MKKIEDFLKDRVGEVILIFALVIISIYAGVGLGILLSLVLVFLLLAIAAHMSKIGKSVYPILQTVVVLLVIGSIVGAFFPRSSAKKGVAMAYLDQGVAELMGDKTKLLAKDIFNINKDEKGKKFLTYYNALLSDGKVQEAQDTLNGWMNVWNFDRKKENNFQSQLQSQTQKQSDSVLTSPVSIPTFYDAVGSYPLVLKNGQESDWITVGPCHRYNFSSDFITLKYEDGTILNVWSAIRLRDEATFKVINRSNKEVSLLVKT
ncbi:MAG: hypothetical protein WC249_01140 [Patescibacteria group bacterium]|jgi:energy-coupling factor transporter transmembrane protein EcfT